MRVACIYLPSLPVQAHVRQAPHLAGEPFAVALSGHTPIIIAVSRAAWEAGARVGTTAEQARAAVPDLQVLPAAPATYQATLAALAETLMQWTSAIDVGAAALAGPAAGQQPGHTHRAIFAQVPTGARGATFADKLVGAANRQGLRARVGIADDRFTAWAAAAIGARREGAATPVATASDTAALFHQTCTIVPRGGSAAFVAPMSIDLLPMDEQVRQLLRSMRVTTVGDFAALPPPSALRRFNDRGVDVHGLSRGDGPSQVQPYEPRAIVGERLELAATSRSLEPALFKLRPVCDRIGERLRGRRRAAAQLGLRLHSAPNEITTYPIELPTHTSSGRALLDAIRQTLADELVPETHTVDLDVITEVEPVTEELELFAARNHRRTRTRRGKQGRSRSRQRNLPLALD